MKKQLIWFLMISSVLLFSGCNTLNGMTQDFKRAQKKTSDWLNNHKQPVQ